MNSDELIKSIKKQILLSGPQDFANALPDSWKPYFEGDFKLGPDGKAHFHPPGSVAPSMSDNTVRDVRAVSTLADGEPLYEVSNTNKVEPPKPIHTPDPNYSEIARKTRTEGTMVLWAMVNKSGDIEKMFVQKPLGLGLDDEAMAAVQKWKFQPARRNGEPVAVQINVEVNFRLSK